MSDDYDDDSIIFLIIMVDFYISCLGCYLGYEYLSPAWGAMLFILPTALAPLIFLIYVEWAGRCILEERSNEI
jgi:hypothetical protein